MTNLPAQQSKTIRATRKRRTGAFVPRAARRRFSRGIWIDTLTSCQQWHSVPTHKPRGKRCRCLLRQDCWTVGQTRGLGSKTCVATYVEAPPWSQPLLASSWMSETSANFADHRFRGPGEYYAFATLKHVQAWLTAEDLSCLRHPPLLDR